VLRTFSTDGELFAYIADMGAGQRRIEIHSARTGQRIKTLESDNDVTAISVSTSGLYLAATSSDGTIRVRSTDRGGELAATVLPSMMGSDIVPSSLQFGPNGHSVALCHGGKCIVWNWQEGDHVTTLDTVDSIYEVSWSPSGESLATGGQRIEQHGILCGTIDLWDAETGAHLRSCGHAIGSLVLGIQSFPDRRCFAVQTQNMVYFYDVFEYKIATKMSIQKEAVTAIDVSPNGASLALGYRSGIVRIWDVKRDECIKQFKACEVSPRLIRFMPDGKHIVSVGYDRNDTKHLVASVIKVWECDTGALVKTLDARTQDDIKSLSLSRDGRWLATSSYMRL
jgi:WD40 repeat protein